jgi:hypothetical protein
MSMLCRQKAEILEPPKQVFDAVRLVQNASPPRSEGAEPPIIASYMEKLRLTQPGAIHDATAPT